MIEYLSENSLPIWMGGAVAFTMALVAYLQTRGNAALLSMVAVVALVAVLLVTERLIETPREAVERTLYELAATVERNDVLATLAFMTPNAVVRKDVEMLMPLVNIERARVISTPQIEFDPNGAVVKCRGFVIATNKQNGMKGGAEDEVMLAFVLRNDRWLLQDYSSQRNWHRALGR
jgi:hypothetical protein